MTLSSRLCAFLFLTGSLMVRLPAAEPVAEPGKPGANARFDRLDADGDGKVSRAKFLGSVRDKKRWWQRGQRTADTDQNAATPEMFTALDRDRDGYLTSEELNSAQRLQESRGDNGEGASTTRNVHPPGDEQGSQKTETETAADKRAQPPPK